MEIPVLGQSLKDHLEFNQFSDGQNLVGSGKCGCKKIGTMLCQTMRYPLPVVVVQISPLGSTFKTEVQTVKIRLARNSGYFVHIYIFQKYFEDQVIRKILRNLFKIALYGLSFVNLATRRF